MRIEPVTSKHAIYLRDESRMTGHAQYIAFPESAADVQAAVRRAARENRPITIQGARTGLVGGAVPHGGLILNMERMNRVLAFMPPVAGSSAQIHVEAGITLQQLHLDIQRLCREHNLPPHFFPPDPTETTATLGGMIAANASGARTFRYGATRMHIQALTLCMASGELLTIRRGQFLAQGRQFRVNAVEGTLPSCRTPALKNAAGYYVAPDMDMLDIFIGSEGTLGIVVAAELKLQKVPEHIWAAAMWVPQKTNLPRLVSLLAEIPGMAAIEYFDRNSLELLRTHQAHLAPQHIPLPPVAAGQCLYAEWHADNAHEAETILETVGIRAEECNVDMETAFFAETEEELQKLKAFRHAVPELVNSTLDHHRRLHPELQKVSTDFAVPEERLGDLLDMYAATLAGSGLTYMLFGHIGNRHLHLNIIPETPDDMKHGQNLFARWAATIVEWGGTISAEHGIGKRKRNLLKQMVGEECLQEMRTLHDMFDPGHLLNAGNIFEE